MLPSPPSARRHYLWSNLLVQRAVREASGVRKAGSQVVIRTVAAHQMIAALQGQRATVQMLAQQGIDEAAQALIVAPAFTTSTDSYAAMAEQVKYDFEFERLVASLVQNAGRAAESVAQTVTPRIGHVRYLSPPSCSRCAVLAGRVYRYSEGFLRHPRCDCTMVPTSLANPAFHHDPADLLAAGQITGLSKADTRALDDGADFGRVVNVRSSAAGLSQPGRVLARAGRPTPEGIYASTSSRDEAIQRLIAAGYVR